MSKYYPCVLNLCTSSHKHAERQNSLKRHTPGTMSSNDFWWDWISPHGHLAACPMPLISSSNADPVTIWGSVGGESCWPSNPAAPAPFIYPLVHHLHSLSRPSLLPSVIFLWLWSGSNRHGKWHVGPEVVFVVGFLPSYKMIKTNIDKFNTYCYLLILLGMFEE